MSQRECVRAYVRACERGCVGFAFNTNFYTTGKSRRTKLAKTCVTIKIVLRASHDYQNDRCCAFCGFRMPYELLYRRQAVAKNGENMRLRPSHDYQNRFFGAVA